MTREPVRRVVAPRVEELFRFDREASAGGCLVGIDEAGRGPWAGPVVAAAVCFPPEADLGLLRLLNDSKKLTPSRRETLAEQIERTALAFGIGSASPSEIDRLDIEKATFLAMQRALLDSGLLPDRIVVDGSRDPGLGLPTRCVVKGDSLSAAIAAASILAKTTRDRLMENLGGEEDPWGFSQHKGYGTAYHQHALAVYGVSEHHRKTFKPVARSLEVAGPSEEFLKLRRRIRCVWDEEDLQAAVEAMNRSISHLGSSEAWLLREELAGRTKEIAKAPKASNRRSMGSAFEDHVADFLAKRGYKILERNYHASRGEIDLIARDGDSLVFVEVKMRRGTDYGSGLEAVDSRKRERMTSAALEYLSHLDHEEDCRFDVVVVTAPGDGTASIDHYTHAFAPGEDSVP